MNTQRKQSAPALRGQGAFEYILLIAGILLIVVIVTFLLKGGVFQQAGVEIGKSSDKLNVNSQVNCLDFCGEGAWAFVKNSDSSFQFTPNTTACPLYKGLNGDANCFYGDNDNASRNGDYNPACNASLVIGDSKYANLHPSNNVFCAYVRENPVRTT